MWVVTWSGWIRIFWRCYISKALYFECVIFPRRYILKTLYFQALYFEGVIFPSVICWRHYISKTLHFERYISKALYSESVIFQMCHEQSCLHLPDSIYQTPKQNLKCHSRILYFVYMQLRSYIQQSSFSYVTEIWIPRNYQNTAFISYS